MLLVISLVKSLPVIILVLLVHGPDMGTNPQCGGESSGLEEEDHSGMWSDGTVGIAQALIRILCLPQTF